MSASKCLLQVFFGRPLFLFPFGFHLKAYLVTLLVGFLKVCPIHYQCPFFISSPIGDEPVRCPRSLLLMVLGHWIRRILLRQKLIKTLLSVLLCSLYCCIHQHWLDIALKNPHFHIQSEGTRVSDIPQPYKGRHCLSVMHLSHLADLQHSLNRWTYQYPLFLPTPDVWDPHFEYSPSLPLFWRCWF